MSIGNLKDQGNKGNNFPYQLKNLQLLGKIAESVSDPCCPTAATEATLQNVALDSTLQQVLSAIQGGSLFFNNLVIDTGSPACATPAGCPTYSEVRVWNGVGFDTTYYNADGAVVIPVTPLEYVNPQYVLNDVLLQEIAINANTGNTVANTGLMVVSTANIDASTAASAASLSVIETNTYAILSDTNDIATDTGTIATNTGFIAANTGAIVSFTNQTASNVIGTTTAVGNTNIRVGDLTETAPATDTASSGLNGRLQRIAQRLSSLITALGTPLQASGTIGSITNTVNVAQVEKTGVSGYTAAITTTAATTVIAAPGAGLFTYITQILVTNSHPTVGTLVSIITQGGTILYRGYVAPAGGRYSVSLPVPIKMPVANQSLQAVCGTTGASVYVSASGYKAV